MKIGPRSSLGVQVVVFALVLCIVLAMPGIAVSKKSSGVIGKKQGSPGPGIIRSSLGDLASSISLYTGLLADNDNDDDKHSSPTPKPAVTRVPTPAASATPRPNIQANNGVTNNMYPVVQMNLSWKRAFRLEPVKFDSGSSYDPDGQITAYEWDFGDGSTGEGKAVEHAYEKEGNYMVRLKVVDNNGADSSAYVTAVISDNPPTSLPGNDTGATVGKPVWLNGAGSYDPDGRIVKYDWSLGDGTAEQGATVMHVYDRPDKYTVTLTVTDDGGLNATASMTVNVAEAEAAPPADPGGLQGMTLLAGAGITCVALILTMRKKTK